MTGAPLRVGVLGCSAIAWRRTIPALHACPETTVVAVASRDGAKAERFAAEFSADATDYAGLLARPDVDAVYLPLPPALHERWGVAVLTAGKHLLVEKPLAADPAAARALVQAAADAGLVLRENFMFLHHPQHARVRDLVTGGRIGEPRALRAAFGIPPLPDTDIRYDPALGGGALLDVGVYPLRLAQHLLGDDLRVTGAVLHQDARGVDVGGAALLVSAAGVPVSVEFGFRHAYGSRYELWGSSGRLLLDRAFTPPPGWQPVLRVEEQDHAEEHTLPAADQFRLSVAAFAAAVRAGHRAGHGPERAWCAAAVTTIELAAAVRAAAVTMPAAAVPAGGQDAPEPAELSAWR